MRLHRQGNAAENASMRARLLDIGGNAVRFLSYVDVHLTVNVSCWRPSYSVDPWRDLYTSYTNVCMHTYMHTYIQMCLQISAAAANGLVQGVGCPILNSNIFPLFLLYFVFNTVGCS